MQRAARHAERWFYARQAVIACAVLVTALVPQELRAQPAPAAKQNAPTTKSKIPAAGTTSLQVSPEQILYLIRSTLLTLNDANRSGNYSVLRDLASPGFQAKNTAADLALAFTDLRRRTFDLFGVALIAPQLTAAPVIDPEGRLRLAGIFPTRPLQIKFDLMFVVHAEQWKLFGIAVATPEAPPLAAQTQAPATPAPATPAPATPAWLSSVTR
jgi:hypothetical protein